MHHLEGLAIQPKKHIPMDAFPLLNLPREIRDQIFGEVLFPGEKQPNDIGEQDDLGLAPTAVRQIFPYDTNDERKPQFEVAVIRTCKQLQCEAEFILYGTSSWNLMYQDWSDRIRLSYEFLENLPRRLRKLCQRVERKCYSRPYWSTISLHDWTMFMTFLARECPLLHTLKLWGPGDTNEGREWVDTCGKEEEWVQAILQIKTLRYFDIPVIRGGVIYDYPAFKDDFLPWLKTSLIEAPRRLQARSNQVSHSHIPSNARPFPFLQLDKSIRERIYCHVLLPHHRRIHPYIKSWYDSTTQNIVPLFLTCKQIHNEAEHVLYSEAILTSPFIKYNNLLFRFLAGKDGPTGVGLDYRRRHMVRNVRFDISILFDSFFCRYLVSCMDTTLEIALDEDCVSTLNREWEHIAPNSQTLFYSGYLSKANFCRLARFEKVVIDTPEGFPLNPNCLHWITAGAREEFIYPSGDERLDWITDETNVYAYIVSEAFMLDAIEVEFETRSLDRLQSMWERVRYESPDHQ